MISSTLGMPGLTSSMLATVGNRALAWKKDYENNFAFVSEIFAYCEEKYSSFMRQPDDLEVAQDCTSLFSLVNISKDNPQSLIHEATRLIKRENKSSSGDSVTSDALYEHLKHVFPLHSKDLLKSIVKLLETSTDSGATVDIQAVIKFCYPLGFSFKVKTMLGNLVFKDKFLPTDVTLNLYAKISKQLTISLRYFLSFFVRIYFKYYLHILIVLFFVFRNI